MELARSKLTPSFRSRYCSSANATQTPSHLLKYVTFAAPWLVVLTRESLLRRERLLPKLGGKHPVTVCPP